METSKSEVIVKDASWYKRNEREWFYVACDNTIHSICNSSLEGLYLPDHDYPSIEVIKGELKILDKEDIDGCYHFIAHLCDEKNKPIECVVKDSGGIGTVNIAVLTEGKNVNSALHFYASRSTAFFYMQYLRARFPHARTRWQKEQRGNLRLEDFF